MVHFRLHGVLIISLFVVFLLCTVTNPVHGLQLKFVSPGISPRRGTLQRCLRQPCPKKRTRARCIINHSLSRSSTQRNSNNNNSNDNENNSMNMNERWAPLNTTSKILVPVQIMVGIYFLLLLPSGLAMHKVCGAAVMGTLPYEYIMFFCLLVIPRSFRYGKFSKINKEQVDTSNRGTNLRDLLIFICVLIGSHWRAAFCHAAASSPWLPSSTSKQFLAPITLMAVRVIATLVVAMSGWTLGKSYDRIARPHELVTSGPYSIVRHPIYTAYLMLFLSGLLTLRSYGGCALMLFASLLFYIPRMDAEDQILENAFGEEFVKYRKKVPWRLIPFLL